MTARLKRIWDTRAAITCTLASLASSATAGRAFAAIDLETPGYDFLELSLKIKTGAGSPANDKAVYLYPAWGDGTVAEQEESNIPSSDAAYTINSPTIFGAPLIMVPVLTAAKTYAKMVVISNILAPRLAGIVVNYAGQALDSTGGNHELAYRGGWWDSV